jgi:REP element-mobilizing transposase RayT
MARKPRIDRVGFYHIVNRGVARANVYLCDDDYLRFLEIVQDASDEYGFEICSFALMTNHYHLLINMKKMNLSVALQKINSRYSMYFNNKYKRVGPLWQGRFKSWYVYDENYLGTLIRYIEFNPIKANITKNIGEYKWAMSSYNVALSMLNFELIEKTNFEKELDEKELENVNELYRSKFEAGSSCNFDKKTKSKDLSHLMTYLPKEQAIYHALIDGYTQKEVGEFLNVSNVAISKIVKIYKQKVKLFNKLRDKGIFWSYKKDIVYDEVGAELLVEYLLKYGDFDDIKLGFELFGKRFMRKVWDMKLKSDKSFIKTNLMLARLFFGMDVESDYFKEVKNERFEKLRMLAS